MRVTLTIYELNMPTFKYSKLVRDNIPTFHIKAGHSIVARTLTGAELSDALIAKLHEEADEIDGALTHDELIEEIADVQQIITDLCAANNITLETLTEVIKKKAARKGGFSKGQYIETVTMPTDDEWVAYCRKSPDKYPEITFPEKKSPAITDRS